MKNNLAHLIIPSLFLAMLQLTPARAEVHSDAKKKMCERSPVVLAEESAKYSEIVEAARKQLSNLKCPPHNIFPRPNDMSNNCKNVLKQHDDAMSQLALRNCQSRSMR